ncbi:MAG: NfeD family protein [Muribaculaceae bacterium]|nr:NfeD family protein [Muribaculaceae bacterium]
MGLWSFWLILGVGFLIAELLTMSTTCLYIGLGALIAMIMAFAGGEWTETIITFVAATAVLYLATYHWRNRLLKFLHRGASHTATGMDALIGRTGRVIQTDRMRVRIDGDTWEVTPAKKDTLLLPDQEVRVVGYDSIVLSVEPI